MKCLLGSDHLEQEMHHTLLVLTLLWVSFKLILISVTTFIRITDSVRMFFNISVLTES
jgi:hypothetical protein